MILGTTAAPDCVTWSDSVTTPRSLPARIGNTSPQKFEPESNRGFRAISSPVASRNVASPDSAGGAALLVMPSSSTPCSAAPRETGLSRFAVATLPPEDSRFGARASGSMETGRSTAHGEGTVVRARRMFDRSVIGSFAPVPLSDSDSAGPPTSGGSLRESWPVEAISMEASADLPGGGFRGAP